MPNLEFGKYAAYIVPAYLISFAVIAGMVADTLLRARHWRREAARREEALAEKEDRRMKRLLPLIPIVVIVSLGILFAGYGLHHDPQVFPAALVGKPLPQRVLPVLKGGQDTRIAAAIKGPGLVNVFQSSCGPCIVEAPQLMQLKSNGVQVVGVAWKDPPQETLAFLDRLGDPFSTVLVDRSGDAGVDFGISGVPETFVVDGKGKVVAKHIGAITEADAAELTRQVKSLQ